MEAFNDWVIIVKLPRVSNLRSRKLINYTGDQKLLDLPDRTRYAKSTQGDSLELRR